VANEVWEKAKTPIVIADLADYAGDIGARTDQIDLTSLASGAARQSDMIDLSTPISAGYLAYLYAVYAAIEFDVAPTSGGVVDFYAAFSPSAVAATANPGGCSGADGAYTGTPGDSLDDSLKQLVPIGSLVVTSDVAPAVGFQFIGFIKVPERYVSFVVDNNADQALEGDAIEMGIRLVPYVKEIQP